MWRVVREGLTQRCKTWEEGWPCGCLGEEWPTWSEPEMGTVSGSEEQPGGQDSRRGVSKDQSRDQSQGSLGPPRPLEGL